jgi:ribosome-binding factor A
VPELMFVHDKSFGYGSRIDKLLADIAKQENENGQ